jgi:small subunit ribosomal protein S21
MARKNRKRRGNFRPVVHQNSRGKKKSIDRLLKEFRRQVRKSGRLREYRKRQYYTKPSDERRRERQQQEYDMKKRQRRQRNRRGY